MSLLIAWLTPVGAQQVASPPSVTVTGIISDWANQTPLVAADVSLLGTSRRTVSDAQGRFFLRDVPIGTHVFRVSRIGYITQDVEITITDPTPLVDIRLFASPIAIEGVTVTGNARAPLSGVVLDAYSGDRLPWAALELSRNVTQRVGRPFSADDQGSFESDDVRADNYLLLVKRLGYESLYVPVSHAIPPDPVVVRLTPDTALIRKVEVVKEDLRTRVNAHPHASRMFGEEQIRYTPARDLCDLLQHLGGAGGPLSGGEIDDGYGIQACEAYSAAEIYQINVFECGRTGSGPAMEGRELRRRGAIVRIYTIEYMERQALRPVGRSR